MKLERVLRSAIKIAAVALTAPATWSVAGQLYSAPIQRVTVQVAALVLVEGALLLGWHMLDTNSRATSAQRGLYASITIVAYVVLWAIAIAHGEGLAGIAFRATLGVLIGYSVFESGILAGIKLRRQADRDIYNHRAVKRYRRRLAIEDAKETIAAKYELSHIRRDVDGEVIRAAVTFEKKRRLQAVTVDHRHELQKLSQPEGNGNLSFPIVEAQKRRSRQQRLSKDQALARTVDILRDNPHASLRDIADQVDRTHETVRRYLDELESDERIVRQNGSGIQVLD